MGQLEAARFQLFVVDNHACIFHVKDLHDVPATVDEDKHTSFADILVHRFIDYSAQGIEAFAHIYRHWVEVVFKRFMEMEHTLSLKDKQESAGEQYPGPALSEDVFHCGIPLPTTYPHQYSRDHEPVLDH